MHRLWLIRASYVDFAGEGEMRNLVVKLAAIK